MIRKLALGAITLALTLATTSIGTLPADAAVGCYGDYCSGKDPMTTGCYRDAQTAAWKDFTNGRLELRYSPTCKTNWARVEVYPIGWAVLTPTPFSIAARQDTGYTQSTSWDVPVGEGTYWSPMIYSPVHLVRAETALSCTGAGDCAVSAVSGENPVRTKYA